MSDTDEFCGQLAHIILELEMSDWVGIDLELMWNILPQSVLRGLSNGEATYYLTLMSSAVNLIKSGPINLMPLVRILFFSFGKMNFQNSNFYYFFRRILLPV